MIRMRHPHWVYMYIVCLCQNRPKLILVRYKLKIPQENCGDPDQTSIPAASDLGLHSLSTSKTWTQVYIGDVQVESSVSKLWRP